MYQDQIVIPQWFQKEVVHLQHTYLLNPGMGSTEAIICQRFYCIGMR